MPLEVLLLPTLKDNYNVLLHEDGRTALIDAPDDPVIATVLEDRGWSLDDILVTHNDWDHVDGLKALKERHGARVIGPKGDADAIGDVDLRVGGGDVIDVLGRKVSVVDTPGHTAGHVSYHVPDDKLAFVGDALFVMGCGRMRGQRAKEMWEGLGEASRAARRHACLCRPRVHAGQCPLCPVRRSRQREPPHADDRGRRGAQGRPADRADDHSGRARDQPVPSRR